MAEERVSSNGWVFYRDRPEWKDVTPVHQDDENVPVVKITYSEKFSDVFDYLRAVMKVNELSERALALTKDAVLLNAANYTVWHYRRVLIAALDKSWQDELRFVTELIEEYPKNYQVWHHRRCIVTRLSELQSLDLAVELSFTKQIFEDDAKNYHAWEHRQFVLTRFNAFDKELEFTESLIEMDVFNNSAWNQRFFVLTNLHFGPTAEQLGKFSADQEGITKRAAIVEQLRDVVNRESQFACAKIEQAPENESSWSYLRGLIDTFCRIVNASVSHESSEHAMRLSDFPQLLTFADIITERNTTAASSSLAHEFAFDLRAAQLEKECADDATSANAEKTATQMRQHLTTLCQLDPVRTEWWHYLRKAHKL